MYAIHKTRTYSADVNLKAVRNCCIALVLLAGLLGPAIAIALEVDEDYHSLSLEFEYLEDPQGTLTIDDLLFEPPDHAFSSSDQSKPTAIFDPVWLKLELDFSANAREKNYLLFGRVENFSEIRLYRPDNQGNYHELVTGNRYPASSRELDTLRYGFTVPVSEEPVTLYIRYIGGPGTNNLPWDLVEENTYAENSLLYYSLDIACFSAIGALLFFNLIIAFSLRRAAYLYYSAYVLSVMMALATMDGIGFYYLWPDFPGLNERALHSFNQISASMRLLAILSFLGIAKEVPLLRTVSILILALLAAMFFAINMVGISGLPPYAATITWAIGIIFGFVICIVAIKRRIKLALPLFLTMLVPFLSAVVQASLALQDGLVSILAMQTAKTGFVLHVMLFSLCLAAQIKIQAESHREALHDKLTGLPQATLLSERFEWAMGLARRQQWHISVLFIDLDGFKRINDTLGHLAGDQLLIQVAARMQGSLRKTDFVARMGGDEFVVLLLNPPGEYSLAEVTQKLLGSISRPYMLDGIKARISASIGAATLKGENDDLASLIKEADAAMYKAKRRGKSTSVLSGSQPALTLVKGAPGIEDCRSFSNCSD